MQHLNIKIFARPAEGFRVADAILVFHRWIQQRALPEMLIDVTDYSHVPAGPGVLLIGHEANYSLDCADHRPGLLYARKLADSSVSAQEALQQAYAAALSAASRLESEPEFAGKLSFDSHNIEVIFNDRLLFPNNDQTWNSVEPELRRFLDALFSGSAYQLDRVGEPRERLRASVHAV